MVARDLREYSGSLSLQSLVFGSDHNIAAAAEVIEVGLVGVIDQSGDSLFAFGEGAVQGDDSRGFGFQVKLDAQIRVGSFITLDGITDQLPRVLAIDDHRLVDAEIQSRLLRLVLIADQFQVASFQDTSPRSPLCRVLDAGGQVVPGRRDHRRIGRRSLRWRLPERGGSPAGQCDADDQQRSLVFHFMLSRLPHSLPRSSSLMAASSVVAVLRGAGVRGYCRTDGAIASMGWFHATRLIPAGGTSRTTFGSGSCRHILRRSRVR